MCPTVVSNNEAVLSLVSYSVNALRKGYGYLYLQTGGSNAVARASWPCTSSEPRNNQLRPGMQQPAAPPDFVLPLRKLAMLAVMSRRECPLPSTVAISSPALARRGICVPVQTTRGACS